MRGDAQNVASHTAWNLNIAHLQLYLRKAIFGLTVAAGRPNVLTYLLSFGSSLFAYPILMGKTIYKSMLQQNPALGTFDLTNTLPEFMILKLIKL